VPRNGDADYRDELVTARANELADGLGNLINRTIVLVRRRRPDGVPSSSRVPPEAAVLQTLCGGLPVSIDDRLAAFDLRAATGALWDVVVEANRFVSAERPWELASAKPAGERPAAERLDGVLAALLDACRVIAHELRPFLPRAADRIETALRELDAEAGRTLFRKAEVVTSRPAS
jgi:methionyl-tRNA synthetase